MAQGKHEVSPEAFANRPVGHGPHVLAPVRLLNVPAEQLAHRICPSAAVNVPISHAVQLPPNNPGEQRQSSHVALPALVVLVPTGHAVQFPLAAGGGLNDPQPQAAHRVVDPENPCTHMQSATPVLPVLVVLACTSGQRMHVPFSAAGL